MDNEAPVSEIAADLVETSNEEKQAAFEAGAQTGEAVAAAAQETVEDVRTEAAARIDAAVDHAAEAETAVMASALARRIDDVEERNSQWQAGLENRLLQLSEENSVLKQSLEILLQRSTPQPSTEPEAPAATTEPENHAPNEAASPAPKTRRERRILL